jgi:DegV family protein with EDD domain
MASIAIVTDSTATIPQELLHAYDIKVAPQVLIWGEESMYDGVDIQPSEFYERLKTTDVMPKSSQATVPWFQEIYEPLVAEGKPIVSILISDKLSGTIQSAEQAKKMFPDAQIEIINSHSASMDLGFQVLAAARAAEEGMPYSQVIEIAKDSIAKTGVIFVVDTLEYLHKNGRIGGAARLMGTALNLKPILEVKGGQVEPVENVRTKGKAIDRLIDLVGDRISDQRPLRVAVLHAAAEEEANALLAALVERYNPEETMITELSPVVGAHVGPGTVGAGFCSGL